MLVALSVVAIFATVWYWVSYLLGPGDGAFRRGPYLTRVTTSEAQLRWRVRGGGDVEITALDPAGAEVRAAWRAARRPAPRHALQLDGERRRRRRRRRQLRHAARGADPAGALRGARRLRLAATSTSGPSRTCSAGQRPEFTVTAGDNSLPQRRRPAARPQHLPPAGRAHAQRPALRGPRRPRRLPAGAGRHQLGLRPARRRPLRLPPRAGAGDRARRAVRPAGRRAGAPGAGGGRGRRCASSSCTCRCSPAIRSCRCCATAASRRSSPGTSTATSGAPWRACARSPSARAGRGPGDLEFTPVSADAEISLIDLGALLVDVAVDGTVAYTFVDERGRVLDRTVA